MQDLACALGARMASAVLRPRQPGRPGRFDPTQFVARVCPSIRTWAWQRSSRAWPNGTCWSD